MEQNKDNSFQSLQVRCTELEKAVTDLVRVGSRGHGNGVKQLANRLIRSAPNFSSDPANFRLSLHAALMTGIGASGLRSLPGDIPVEGDSAVPLAEVDVAPRVDGFVLDGAPREAFDEIVNERSQADRLRQAGVQLTRTLLLEGPPGVGKTLGARWLANRLDLPLVTLDLAMVVSSYLGTSGRNIKAVLDYAKSAPCVLLLDEFDAIAKRRDDEADVGELKRLVNVILVELDRWPDSSLLIAATNHPQLIDPAAGRRFDRVVTIPLPDRTARRHVLQELAAFTSVPDPALLDLVADATDGHSNSDLARLWNLTLRRSILQSTSVSEELVREILRNASTEKGTREMLYLKAHEDLGLSNRQIASLAGVTHPTVSAGLDRARRRAHDRVESS